MPVIFPPHVTHAQIKIVDAKPISAGFFRRGKHLGLCETYGESESLKLTSNKEDGRLLDAIFCDAPTSFYLDF